MWTTLRVVEVARTFWLALLHTSRSNSLTWGSSWHRSKLQSQDEGPADLPSFLWDARGLCRGFWPHCWSRCTPRTSSLGLKQVHPLLDGHVVNGGLCEGHLHKGKMEFIWEDEKIWSGIWPCMLEKSKNKKAIWEKFKKLKKFKKYQKVNFVQSMVIYLGPEVILKG